MAKIALKNVRLSFPNLFRKAVFNGEETKFESTFLLNKKEHADTIKVIEAQIAELIKDDLKGVKLKADKICLKDGDEIDYDGYAGCMSIKGANSKRPMVIDRAKAPLTEDDNVIYAGCYVNASVDLWVQNNQYGKRINCNLLAVQFVKDGEAFGAGGASGDLDDFDEIDDMDDFM